MNHLPWPNVPPVEVPYICDEIPVVDGGNFLDYPIESGWSTAEDPFQWIRCSHTILAKRAQSWLFFGLLQVLIGRQIDKQEYTAPATSSDSNEWVISTRLLAIHCSELVQSINDAHRANTRQLPSRNSLLAAWRRVFPAAKLHSEVLYSHSVWEDPALMLITSPIPILLEKMQRVANEIFLFHGDDCPALCRMGLHPSFSPLCRMLDSQWCPAQAGNIFQLYGPSMNHYLSGLPRRHLNSHDKGCSREICVANNVNEDSYQTQHTQENCTCQSVGPDPGQIAELIQGNHIPLVRLRVADGRPEVSLVAAEIGTKYVSMSHVWAGGLGNFKENKLPTCQLLRLYGLLSELDNFRPPEPKLAPLFQAPPWLDGCLQILAPIRRDCQKLTTRIQSAQDSAFRDSFDQLGRAQSPDVCFWMDTLCVPVRPEDRPLRIKAINDMNLIYAAAERCLVLDPELQQISMKGLSPIQINAHVLCSTWLTRSWTFQEARLSRAWYARFADGFYNPNSQENALLHHRLYADWNVYKSDAHELASLMISWYADMPALRRSDIIANQGSRLIDDEVFSFIAIWNQLVSRSTSKMEDVNIIMANTLDLSAGEVLAMPSEQRMKAIFNTRNRLPAGLMFNDAKKIRDQSSRWVPLYPENSRLSLGWYGTLTPSATGFFLDNVDGNPVGFMVDPSVPRYEKIRLLDSTDETIAPLWIRFNQESGNFPTNFEALVENENNDDDILAVVYVVGNLRRSLEERMVARGSQGARFALKGKEGKTLHLVYEYSFLYNHQRRNLYRESADLYVTVHAQRTDEDAVFHVDCNRDQWPTLRPRRDTSSEHTSHGLYFYTTAYMVCFFLVWTPFYLASVFYYRPPHLVIPGTVFALRGLIGVMQILRLRHRVSERAYRSWVKTFDETGTFKQSPGTEKYTPFRTWVGEIRTHVLFGLAISIWAIAVLVPAVRYLVWIAMAVVVEACVEWGVHRLWWGTGIKKVVKGWVKRRGWW
ncbi:MAG: hypothetical protein Q9178_007550 [Gyalolechia marmorata]